MPTYYQTDIKVAPGIFYAGENRTRATLYLSASGDIQVTTGMEKLASQILRIIVNDNLINSNILNSSNVRSLKALLTMQLSRFRQAQIDMTNRADPNLMGFNIYRYAGLLGQNSFRKISNEAVQYSFSDSNLSNGITYTYGVKKVYMSGVESDIVEKLDATPTAFLHQQEYVIGQFFTVKPISKGATVYVDYNRTFKTEELLDSITGIAVSQDTNEPRKYIISITGKTLEGTQVSLSSKKLSL
jgi:hypothetical protein